MQKRIKNILKEFSARRYALTLSAAFVLMLGMSASHGQAGGVDSVPYCRPEITVGKAQTGIASWYGPNFHGRKTSSGEIYDMHALTAAHRTLPMDTMVRVTNRSNGESVTVRINDRGPYVGKRVIDLSLAAARALDMKDKGVSKVEITVLCHNTPPVIPGEKPRLPA